MIIQRLQNYTTIDPLIAGIIFVAALVLAGIVYVRLDSVLRLVSKYLGVDIDPELDRFKLPIAFTLGSIVGLICLTFITLPPVIRNNLISGLLTVILLVWTRSFIEFGKSLLTPIVVTHYDDDLAPIVRNIWTICALLTVLGGVLFIWSIDITPLLASAGVVGIIAGFAARDTIANFFGSISLYADETYRKGDFIELDEEVRGIVINVSIRSTQIQTLDGDIVTIPNSKLNNTIIKNKSQPNKNHRLTLPFGVEYGTDPDEVKELATEILKDSDRVQSQPVPQVYLSEFGDSAINFEILCYSNHPRHKYTIKDSVYRQLYTRLQEENIGIPFPHREVYFTDRDETVSNQNRSDNS